MSGTKNNRRSKAAKNSNSPSVNEKPFFLKGSQSLDWGMQNRLSRIFSHKSGRTVMLPFDHGYVMGPTSGLERIDLSVVPLIDYADSIMCTRGALRSSIPPIFRKPVCLRFSAGSTLEKEFNDEALLDIEEAIRLNVSALAVTVNLGEPAEGAAVKNLIRTVDLGYKYGIPTMVTAQGKQVKDAKHIAFSARVCAENGANIIKTYYPPKDFEKVVNSCPVPIVIAGGKKMPEKEALTICYHAMLEGASGVDMGRNIFQSSKPVAMIRAIVSIVHDGLDDEQAFELFNDLS